MKIRAKELEIGNKILIPLSVYGNQEIKKIEVSSKGNILVYSEDSRSPFVFFPMQKVELILD